MGSTVGSSFKKLRKNGFGGSLGLALRWLSVRNDTFNAYFPAIADVHANQRATTFGRRSDHLRLPTDRKTNLARRPTSNLPWTVHPVQASQPPILHTCDGLQEVPIRAYP